MHSHQKLNISASSIPQSLSLALSRPLSLFLSLSLSLTHPLSLFLSLTLSLSLSLSLSHTLSLFLSLTLSLSLSLSLSAFCLLPSALPFLPHEKLSIYLPIDLQVFQPPNHFLIFSFSYFLSSSLLSLRQQYYPPML